MATIVWNDARLRELAAESVRARGARVAAGARALAPRRTGAGAASIRNWQAGEAQRIGWGLHYMAFQDLGFKHHGARGRYHPGTHFLERALRSYAGG